jgi:UDP-glucose 4-epimerase
LPIPSPLFGGASGAGKRLGLFDFTPDLQRLLRYGRAVDTVRLRREVGFAPRYTTLEAIEDFVASRASERPEAGAGARAAA